VEGPNFHQTDEIARISKRFTSSKRGEHQRDETRNGWMIVGRKRKKKGKIKEVDHPVDVSNVPDIFAAVDTPFL